MGDKKLRIAVLIRNYSASGGGAERYCVELTNRLSNIHEVHVFSQHKLLSIKYHNGLKNQDISTNYYFHT